MIGKFFSWESRSHSISQYLFLFLYIWILNCSSLQAQRNFTLQRECTPENGSFECTSGTECIPANKVCDGKPNDCADGSDEWSKCELSCASLSCEHGCVPNVEPGLNGTCYCRPGYKITGSRGVRCKDINECEIWGTCSQKCENFEGSFQCSCEEGFILGPNNRTCTPEDPNLLVVYALTKSVRVWNMKTKKQYPIMENQGQTVSVTVDVHHGKVLWTDITDKREAVFRADVTGNGTVETVVDFGLGLAEGLALDWITGNIYFTDSNKRQVVACLNDGSYCAVLVRQFLDKPRELAVDPNEGLMFWTNWGEKASIIRAQMNGLFAKPIVLDGLKWPNGLAVDLANSRVYWSDANFDLIETVDFNGQDRHEVRSKGDSHHFSLDLFGDTLFWSDWQVNEIRSCNKFTGLDDKVIVQEGNSGGKLSKPNGLSIFHPAAQPKTRSNTCERASCSHICVLAPNNDFSCVCPPGMILDSKGFQCHEDLDTAKIVIGHDDRIASFRFGSIGKDVIDEFKLKEKTQIGAVHYNAVNNTVFVSDTFWRKIHEFDPATRKLTTIVESHIDSVTGLSLDVIGQNLYWVDNTRRKVEVMSLRTGARALISSEKDYPQDIIVVPEKRLLFVALTSSKLSRIMKYNMNGYNRTTLVRINRGAPVALTYNQDLEHIFWCDIYKDTIEHISLGGRQQAVAVQHNSPFSIASFHNRIFWIDRRTQQLNAMTILGADYLEQSVFIGKAEHRRNTTLTSYFEGNFLAKMAILQKDLSIYKELMEQHECSVTRMEGPKCSHICLMSNDENVGTCLCPDGMELESDFATCAPKCYDDQFQCSDKRCISSDWHCDGFEDCSGGEDEVDCIKTSLCDPFDYECIAKEGCTPGDTECISKFTPSGNSKNETDAPTDPVFSPKSGDSNKKRPSDMNGKKKQNPGEAPKRVMVPPRDPWAPPMEGNDDDGEENLIHDARSLESIEENSSPPASSSGAATGIIIAVVLLLLIVAVIIGFVLHKRRISPKTLVQPYVQQLVKYVNRPSGGGAKREQLNNDPVYDDTLDNSSGNYGSGHYANPLYEEIESIQNAQWNRNNSDSSKGESRSADSGILTVMDTDPNNLYEDVDDHYMAHSHKQKLISDRDLV